MKTAFEIFRKYWKNHKTDRELLLSTEDQNMIEAAMEEYAMQFKEGMIEWMKKCNALQNQLLLIEHRNATGKIFNQTIQCEQAPVMPQFVCDHPKESQSDYHDSSIYCEKCGCIIEQFGKKNEPPHKL